MKKPKKNKIGPKFKTPFTKEDKDKTVTEVFTGKLTIDNLADSIGKELYEKTADKLIDGMEAGFNIEYGLTDEDFIQALRDNIYMFSAAKTATQAEEMNSLLVDENGNRLEFDEFRDLAEEKFDVYNSSYLESEYNTAIAEGRSKSMWKEFDKNKKEFSNVQWITAPDELTCDDCGDMDGVVFSKDDAPDYDIPMHPNCRCNLIETNDDINASDDDPEKDDEWKTDDDEIFSDEHPYFDIDEEDREIAEDNWGLKIPD